MPVNSLGHIQTKPSGVSSQVPPLSHRNPLVTLHVIISEKITVCSDSFSVIPVVAKVIQFGCLCRDLMVFIITKLFHVYLIFNLICISIKQLNYG